VVVTASVVVTPIEGWGYSETIDGELSPPFEVSLSELGADMGDGIRGWRGQVVTADHKYSGMAVQMTPRHVEDTGVVVLTVIESDEAVFSGMADTTGLERNWK
jgi:hypothetical protein